MAYDLGMQKKVIWLFPNPQLYMWFMDDPKPNSAVTYLLMEVEFFWWEISVVIISNNFAMFVCGKYSAGAIISLQLINVFNVA